APLAELNRKKSTESMVIDDDIAYEPAADGPYKLVLPFDLSRNTGFERWFNLHQNTKYRKLEVDWHSTFQALDNDEPHSSTSFLASSKKKSRVKYLIEELPTIEHMKKRRPDLYNNWLCPNCESQQETFSYVWLCLSVSHVMNQIITASKQDIVWLIIEKVTALHPG